RDHVGGVLGEEVHAADDRVGGDDEIAVRRRGEYGRVIAEGERAWMARQRPEVARDQPLFGGLAFVLGPVHLRYSVLSNSAARSFRASWSSTALTIPVSSRSRKALATSTYSDTPRVQAHPRAGRARRRRPAAPRAGSPRCA